MPSHDPQPGDSEAGASRLVGGPPVGGRYLVTWRWQSASVLGFGTQRPRTAHLAERPEWVSD